MSLAELQAAENDAVLEAVRMQEGLGLRSITDREYRRTSWHRDFLYAIGRVEKVKQSLAVEFHNAERDISFTPAATATSSNSTTNGPAASSR